MLTFKDRDDWLKERDFAGTSLKRLGEWNNIDAFSQAVHALTDGAPRDKLDQPARLFVGAFNTPDSKTFLRANLRDIQDAFRRKAKKRSGTTLSVLVSNWVGYVVLWTDDTHQFIAWRWWLREEDRRKFDLVQTLGMTT